MGVDAGFDLFPSLNNEELVKQAALVLPGGAVLALAPLGNME